METTVCLEIPETRVLGVFGGDIHLLSYAFDVENEKEGEEFDCILVVSRKLYLLEWIKWLNGKRDHCEKFKEYCGVLGQVYSKEATLMGDQQVQRFNEGLERLEIATLPMYRVRKFDKPEFEHG